MTNLIDGRTAVNNNMKSDDLMYGHTDLNSILQFLLVLVKVLTRHVPVTSRKVADATPTGSVQQN